jgi:hypothetical protein
MDTAMANGFRLLLAFLLHGRLAPPGSRRPGPDHGLVVAADDDGDADSDGGAECRLPEDRAGTRAS